MIVTYALQKFKVSGQLVPKIEWKQKDGWTDKRMVGGDCITCYINEVGNDFIGKTKFFNIM